MEHSRSPRWMTLPYRSARKLDFDVPRPLDELLDEDGPLPERLFRDRARRREAFLHLVGRGDLLHPLPAAAGGRLDQERPPHPVAEPDHLLRFVDILQGGGHRHAGRRERLARRDLVAQDPHHAGGRADEDQPLPVHGVREVRVLRQESVPGEDRVAAGVLRRAQDRVDVEVAQRGGGRPEADRLVGELHVQGEGVAVGIPHRHGDSKLPRGPDGPAGDLSPVGDEDFPEVPHAAEPTRCPCR